MNVAQARLNNPALIADYPLGADKELADQGVDTVVEVSGLTIRFIYDGASQEITFLAVITYQAETSYRLSINAEYRLIDASDQTVIHQRSFTYRGPSDASSHWRSRRFREVIQAGYRDLVEQVVEWLAPHAKLYTP